MPLVPDARVEVVRCASYAELHALIWVSKPWQSDVMREAAHRLVHDKYSFSTLMAFINWAPEGRWISKTWKNVVMREAAYRLKHDEYSSSTLMAFINWAPEETRFEVRVQRLVDIAREAGDSEFDLMDETSFRTLVKIQLALQHRFLARGQFPLRLRHVVDLLVRSVARGWSSTHPVVQLVLKNLDFLPDDLEVEVGDKIQLMQKAWRRSGMDVVTIGSVLIALQSMFPQRFDRIMCMWRSGIEGWRIERGLIAAWSAGSPAPPRDAGSSARAGAGEGRGSTSGSAG